MFLIIPPSPPPSLTEVVESPQFQDISNSPDSFQNIYDLNSLQTVAITPPENFDLNLLNQEKNKIKDQDLELNIKEDSEFALDDEIIVTVKDFIEVENELITNTKTNNINQHLVF